MAANITPDFDTACAAFSMACLKAADWKHTYFGAAYMSRVETAFEDVRKAFEAVVEANKK